MGRKTALERRLAELDNQGWGDTPESSGFGEVPEGKYQVQFGTPAGVINESKSSGRLQVSWTMTIANGEFAGRKLFKHDGLDTEISRSILRNQLNRLGIEWPASAAELAAEIESLDESFAEVAVKVKGEYTNVYFNNALDNVESEIGGDDQDDGDDDTGGETDSGDDSWDVGSRVWVDEFSDEEPGEVIALDEDAETATVKFDSDGTESDHPWAEVHPIDADDDGAEDDDGDDNGDTGDDDGDDDDGADGVEIEFGDDDISDAQTKAITTLAKANEFNPDDYPEWSELLTDIADYVEVTGTFATAKELIAAIKTKIA